MQAIFDGILSLVKLSWQKMVIALLLLIIACTIYFSNDAVQSFKNERDDYKVKYDSLYIRFNRQVDKNQEIQNKLNADCNEQFKLYNQQKATEIRELQVDYNNNVEVLQAKLSAIYFSKHADLKKRPPNVYRKIIFLIINFH